jgi:hypothetical protein
MSARVQFIMTDEAIEIINNAATERKRGDWLSSAVVEYNRIVTGLPAAAAQDDGLLERIDARLANVERQLAVIIQKAGHGV